MNNRPNTSAAATDVTQFISDLDGGQLEHKLSVALSKVAAASVDNCRVGEVSLKLKISVIPGTHQVRVEHHLEFKAPTESGHTSEKEARASVMHVGPYGAMTLAQPPLPGMQQREIEHS